MSTNSTLPGVAGVVGLTNDPLRGHLLLVDGVLAKRTKGEYLLPGVDGTPVPVRVQGRFLAEHPILKVGEHAYTTGGLTPRFLLVIAFLPLLFLFGGNVVAVLLAAVGVLANVWIVRGPRAEAWKSAVILSVFVGGVLLMTIWAFMSSWVLSLLGR